MQKAALPPCGKGSGVVMPMQKQAEALASSFEQKSLKREMGLRRALQPCCRISLPTLERAESAPPASFGAELTDILK